MWNNTCVNLIRIQKAFGYGTVSAYNIYRVLKDNNLLSAEYPGLDVLYGFSEKAKQKFSSVSREYAENILCNCKKEGIRAVGIEDKDFPNMLRNIPCPPLVLYIKGELPDFDKEPAVCIVGPRNVSEFGAKAAYSLAYRFSSAGITVVSGAAKGCDTCAHKGAIKSGGKTVGVLGCGIGADCLPESKALRESILQNGCLLSEYPPKTHSTKFTFPVRNRIMSGLCAVTVVVEGGVNSGALITAHHANDQGREVFVIPGNPTLPQYKGSNDLLRDCAHPLLEASDVLNEYYLHYSDKIDLEKAYKKPEKVKKDIKDVNNLKILNKTLSKEAKIVYNSLDKQKFTADDLLGLGIGDDELLSALTELEIEHLIKALPGGIYTVIKP